MAHNLNNYYYGWILYNRLVLFCMFAAYMANLAMFIKTQEYELIFLLVSSAVLTFFINKNMTIVLFSAIAITHIFDTLDVHFNVFHFMPY